MVHKQEYMLMSGRWSGIFQGIGAFLVFAIYMVCIGGTFWGYYHAFTKHGSGDGWVSVVVPPFAWYRAIESTWHDDFAGVDWAKRVPNDGRTGILILRAASSSDAAIADKITAAVEGFTKKLGSYPAARRAEVKLIVDTYLAYEASTFADVRDEFNLELSGQGDGIITIQPSNKTLALQKRLRKFSALDDVLKSRALEFAVLNEKLRRNKLRNLSPAKIERLRLVTEMIQVAARVLVERMRQVRAQIFPGSR